MSHSFLFIFDFSLHLTIKLIRSLWCWKASNMPLPKWFVNLNDQVYFSWAVVVAQLVERSLPIPEVRRSNPVIGKNFLYWTVVYCQLCIEKTKIKEKRPRMAHFFKKSLFFDSHIYYYLLFKETSCKIFNCWIQNSSVRRGKASRLIKFK